MWIIGITIFSNICYSVNVSSGVIFGDGTYNYTAIQNFTVDKIQVENNELYLDGLDYCRWAYRGTYLTTDRECTTAHIEYGQGYKNIKDVVAENQEEQRENETAADQEVLTVKKVSVKKSSDLLIILVTGLVGIILIKIKRPPKPMEDEY